MPPHTIAWLYDSAANETIVYVNPTDQTLSIGNSGLLEIHLQGIATVEASDFVSAPTTAPRRGRRRTSHLDLAATAEIDATIVSMTADEATFDWTDDGSRTARTSDAGDSSVEPRTHSSEHTNDDAAIARASEKPIERSTSR